MNYDWVFTAGNRRSGSTVHYHYVRELIEFAGIGRGYGAAPGGAIATQSWDILDHQDEAGVKVWRSHRPTNEIRYIVANMPRTRIVYIHRDIRDCLVSTMNHEPHKEFSWFLGSWVDDNLRNEKFWVSAACPTLITKYEEMIGDPLQELHRLRSFLDLDTLVPDEFLVELYQKYHIDKVRKETQESQTPSDLYKPLEKEDKGWAVGEGGFRPFTKNHVHKGTWGQFLEVLSADEIYEIERRCRENLVNRDYPLYNEIQEK